ncbi:MFS transporter [Paenibacillus sp. TAB 01]|uniref:MFS transporter n=1 Tax=Paenibacillus sp. TAB 01 TaxID=3368988 RepID=UPI003750676F
MNRLVWIACCFYLLIGFTSVISAALLPELLMHYGRSYGDGGNLVFAQFTGFLLGVLTQPWWSRRFGRSRMLSFTLLFICIGYLVIGFLPSWPVVMISLGLVGLGSGMIESTVGALIIDTIVEKTAVAMSRLEVFFGVGALAMPMLISLLIVMDAWRITFYAVCLLAMILMLVWRSFCAGHSEWIDRKPLLETSAAAASGSSRRTGSKARLAVLTVCIAVFITYVGLEMSIVSFLPSIMVETMKVDAAAGSLSVSFFWGTMVLGRLFCGVLAERYGYTRYLLWCSLGTAAVLIGFVLMKQLAGAFVMIMLLGLLMSGLFSIALVFSNTLFPGQTEQTTSKLIAASGIGGAVFSWLTGRLMEQASVTFTLWFLVTIAVVMVAAILLMSRLKPRANRKPQESSFA